MAADFGPLPDFFGEEAVLSGDGVSIAFNVATLDPAIESQDTFEIVIVAVQGDKVLVAVPAGAWDKRSDRRKLVAGSILKPVKLTLAACTEEDRINPADGKAVNVWVGWLGDFLRGAVAFDSGSNPSVCFVDKDTGDSCFPFAEALVAAAKEKFKVLGLEGEKTHLRRIVCPPWRQSFPACRAI